MKPVAYISERVVNMLHLPISPGTPVFIGESNIEHIKKRHPYEYEKYMPDIGSIINFPDYIGQSPKDASILFVKLYQVHNEYIRVAVRITSSGRCYAKTLHLLSTCNAERYIEKGTLKKLDTN
ncbi:MAG: transposase [Lachnospiraceae bacterium]|jgi:hypothetical protein|nr:transposase [Lachnospiraceae bacterium]MCI9601462.1 transposase [Lachnospiraceae bacterium]